MDYHDRPFLSPLSIRPKFQDRGMANGQASFYLSTQLPCIPKKSTPINSTFLPLSEQIQLLEQAFQQQTAITTLRGINLQPIQVRFTPYLLLASSLKSDMATTGSF